MATAAPTDTGPATWTESTEYGLPRDPAAPQPRYGWLGAHQRNTGDALAQLTLMGARLYNPTTGRFLSTNPVPGGSCNDYDYVCADPVNSTDLDGNWRCRWCRKAGRWAWKHKWEIALTAASFTPGLGQAAAELLGRARCSTSAPTTASPPTLRFFPSTN